MNTKQWGVATLGLISIVLAGCGTTTEPSNDKTTLAQCLTQKGAIMYGTNRCQHCQNQKKLFEDAFNHINFVDCDKNETVCKLAGVKGYPTWKFANGTVLQGTQSLDALAQAAHCGPHADQQVDTEQTTGTMESLSGDVDLESGDLTPDQTGSTLSGETATGNVLDDVVITPSTGAASTGA